jgi:hypothetical protein
MAQEPEVRLTTGQRIRWLMENLGLKPRDVWPRSGASESAFYLYSYDRRDIPGPVAARVAETLETTTDFLLCMTDDPRPGDSAKASYTSGLPMGELAMAQPA